ncbi:MAG: PilW family protein [Gammaproteobacteria bacterium]
MYCKNHCNTGHRIARLQRGFSLIELMVAMTVGLIVLGGLTRIYVGSKNAYTVQDEMGKLQENGRFAEEFIAFDVRMAGFQGCGNLFRTRPNIIATPPPSQPLTADNAIVGYEWDTASGTRLPALPAALTADLGPVQAGTDVVTIQRGNECGATLTGNMGANTADVQVTAPNSCGFAQDQYLMITDCRTADIFRASSASNGAGTQTIAHASNVNIDDRLSKDYQADAQVYRFTSVTYYIAPGTDGRPALWRYTEGGAADLDEELVPGAEDLQVLYGEDLDNNQAAERYLSANSVAMGKVTSVRIALLMQSASTRVALDRQQYTYNDQTLNAADGRLRRTFTAVVNLRNRTLNTPN